MSMRKYGPAICPRCSLPFGVGGMGIRKKVCATIAVIFSIHRNSRKGGFGGSGHIGPMGDEHVHGFAGNARRQAETGAAAGAGKHQILRGVEAHLRLTVGAVAVAEHPAATTPW